MMGGDGVRGVEVVDVPVELWESRSQPESMLGSSFRVRHVRHLNVDSERPQSTDKCVPREWFCDIPRLVRARRPTEQGIGLCSFGSVVVQAGRQQAMSRSQGFSPPIRLWLPHTGAAFWVPQPRVKLG